MPVMAVLLVRLPADADFSDLNRWRRDLLTEFDPDAFGLDGPLTWLKPDEVPPRAAKDDAHWLDAGLEQPHYGEGYERGDAHLIARVAEWFERRLPGCEVWYGHDVDDRYTKPFGPAEREALLAYYARVGHEPYQRNRPPRSGK